MVLIVYKKSETNNFVIECNCQTFVGQLLQKIIEVNNIRVYLDRLIWSVDELANRGVLKPPELQGVSWEDYQKNQKEFAHLSPEMKEYATKPKPEKPMRYVSDKNNQRYGVIFDEQTKEIITQAVAKARQILASKKEVTNLNDYVETIDNLRDAVCSAYPAYIGLPEWEPTLMLFEEKVALILLQTENFEVYDESATVWWAGKELEKSKPISEYVGKNQKTKAIVKLQKIGGEQPLRQPPIDGQTYQKMVKYYYKKVDETKQFEKNSVENHYDKVETKDLKAKLHFGEGQEIKYKAFS